MSNQSESIKELASALVKVQASVLKAKKASDNPYFKSKYADLTEVWDACREQLTANGFAVIQLTDESDDAVVVVTKLVHSSGEWVEGRLRMKPVKNDPQGIGSCITYARRYALAAIVGVATEDDDGNAASGKDMGDQSNGYDKYCQNVGATYVNTPEQQDRYPQDKKDTRDRIIELSQKLGIVEGQRRLLVGKPLSLRMSLAELQQAEQRLKDIETAKELGTLSPEDYAIIYEYEEKQSA